MLLLAERKTKHLLKNSDGDSNGKFVMLITVMIIILK